MTAILCLLLSLAYGMVAIEIYEQYLHAYNLLFRIHLHLSSICYLSFSSPEQQRNIMNFKDGSAGAGLLSVDEVAIIFSFLPPKDIMRARICSTWRDAAKKTTVPLCDFAVDGMRSYNLMRVMTTALPNLQQIWIKCLYECHQKYHDGEDPDDEEAEETADYFAYDIDIISNFSKLRVLRVSGAPLNGRYPVLFNLPPLQSLTIVCCYYLKIDLGMLTGLPLLKELNLGYLPKLTGNLNNLRPLKDTLESICIHNSRNVSGNLMDLADFPHLERLSLLGTSVTGDVRDIRAGDFPSVSRLHLPHSVVGGGDYAFQSIPEVPRFMQAIHALLHRVPGFRPFWRLSENSPDWYGPHQSGPRPPLSLKVIKAGPRLGWTWFGHRDSDSCCEINWLDPEPSSDSNEYEIYVEELQRIERNVNFYRGYHQPPTEEEYRRLWDERVRSLLQSLILLTI